MWIYEQKTGRLLHDDAFITRGYSGAGVYKNDPTAQDRHNEGPLPQGLYTILSPVDTHTHGPYVLWLEPDPSNVMFGRSAFGIHGDSVVHPGTASEGCIILLRAVRKQIWLSGDHTLTVIEGDPSHA